MNRTNSALTQVFSGAITLVLGASAAQCESRTILEGELQARGLEQAQVVPGEYIVHCQE